MPLDWAALSFKLFIVAKLLTNNVSHPDLVKFLLMIAVVDVVLFTVNDVPDGLDIGLGDIRADAPERLNPVTVIVFVA